MKKPIFVVIANHDTSHGPTGTPICISRKIQEVLNAARLVNILGYQFFRVLDADVVIYAMNQDKPLSKVKAGDNIVFIRRLKRNSSWEEIWENKKFMPKEERGRAA